jgi:hypothetical protein
VFVRPHTAEDDIVFFSTLESIDTSDLDIFVKLPLKRAIELHEGYDVGPLSFIRGHDADLTRNHAGLEESRHDFLDIRCLSSGNMSVNDLHISRMTFSCH